MQLALVYPKIKHRYEVQKRNYDCFVSVDAVITLYRQLRAFAGRFLTLSSESWPFFGRFSYSDAPYLVHCVRLLPLAENCDCWEVRSVSMDLQCGKPSVDCTK